MGLFIGTVVSLFDENGGDRIKVRTLDDKNRSEDEVDYAFPLLPKMFSVKPKIGESVLVLTKGEDSRTQRFYIGPIISQPQRMYKDYSYTSASSLLKGGRGDKLVSIERFPDANDALPEEDETYISGRKNSDVIISDNDIRIRCGCKILDNNAVNKSEALYYNQNSPTFIKLNFYEKPIYTEDKKEINGSINVVSDYINILSNNGSPYFNLSNRGSKQISDEVLKEIIDKAHPVPWGDSLVYFLQTFVNAFLQHTHNYNNLRPVEDINIINLQKAVTTLENDILSKHIRIN